MEHETTIPETMGEEVVAEQQQDEGFMDILGNKQLTKKVG